MKERIKNFIFHPFLLIFVLVTYFAVVGPYLMSAQSDVTVCLNIAFLALFYFWVVAYCKRRLKRFSDSINQNKETTAP